MAVEVDVLLEGLMNFQKSISSKMSEVEGPHDWTHPSRMLKIGEKLKHFILFDNREFKAAVTLHNVDRIKSYRERIFNEGFGTVCRNLLFGIGFSEEAENRIIDAVEKHSKLDKPDDSSLLIALRSADRLDWLGPIGVVGAAYMWTINGMYGDPDPFTLTERGNPRNFYQDAIRQTEWYRMLPSDEVRSIVDPHMPGRLCFLRSFAAEISDRHGIENMVERDLKRALGLHYLRWSA
ncbi:MAG: hypothetical protein HYT62_00100 [Candidatus Yanofskybacteria bacterium]|nr:hypothetical protein [Candidatus Yanofskybacteria bacterium]